MKNHLVSTLLAASLLLFGSAAQAGLLSFAGVLDGSEPTFDHLGGGPTQTPFDFIEFTVDTAGSYDFLSFYPGDVAVGAQLDGFLLLYSAFDRLAPGDNLLVFDDDYNAGTVAGLAAFDGACVISNCSGFSAALTASTTYVLVQTSFTDVANSFGQPTGLYETTISGVGNITNLSNPTAVPVPGTLLLLLSGLFGLHTLRRRILKA